MLIARGADIHLCFDPKVPPIYHVSMKIRSSWSVNVKELCKIMLEAGATEDGLKLTECDQYAEDEQNEWYDKKMMQGYW